MRIFDDMRFTIRVLRNNIPFLLVALTTLARGSGSGGVVAWWRGGVVTWWRGGVPGVAHLD